MQAYQRHAALSQVRAARSALDAARRQVVLDLRESHHDLAIQAQARVTARALVSRATQADSVAEARYRAGAGTLQDLLTARAALADARQEDIQARAALRIARLRLVVLGVQPLEWEPRR